MQLESFRIGLLVSMAVLGACSSPKDGNLVGSGSGSGGSGGTSPIITVPDSGVAGTGGGPITMLPADFTKADIGGWKLGDPITGGDPGAGGSGGAGGSTTGCGTLVLAVARDMQTSHPDFEDYVNNPDGVKGIVADTLGPNRKPVYAPAGATAGTTSAMDFDQWYRNTDGVNMPYKIEFFLEPQPNGQATFESNMFFPFDDAGFGRQNLDACDTPSDCDHNFHFTTEIHTQFKYNGGETFRFIGDDDLWVFINDRLAIDLGGVHNALEDEVNLDDVAGDLGIQVGGIYPLDLFHAERHTYQSNFRIDTSLEFVNCGVIVDVF